MKRKPIYLFSGLILIAVAMLLLLVSSPQTDDAEFSETVKVSLREVGHQLLLANQDSTSLVRPVIQTDSLNFQLTFQKQLAIQPDSLVAIIKRSLQKAALPEQYRAEVIECSNLEVAYSYQVDYSENYSIIPCMGRVLPEKCYTVHLRFAKGNSPALSTNYLGYAILFIGMMVLLGYFVSKRPATALKTAQESQVTIGSFQFYPEQHKLVKQATEITLSNKECELLALFVAHPNQVIKRDTLTKKVWEDHGVIVGRSLDTYISKLRKKLQEDETIKLTNVHGVGYKLEIEA